MTEITTVKTIAVVAIIFGCFAVLYPKLFHPMIMNSLGLSDSKKKDDFSTYLPPQLRKPNMGQPHSVTPGMGGHDHGKQGMRGPHPGMRAAAEMSKQGGGGGGKGLMGVVLPIYAIGIVCYLVYTLVKVFSNKKPDETKLGQRQRDASFNSLANIRYNAEKNKFTMAGEESEDEDEEEVVTRNMARKQKDLERLLLKADKDKIGDLEMRELKRRLAETEAQMAQILQAMSGIQETTETLVQAQHDTDAPVPEAQAPADHVENIGRKVEEATVDKDEEEDYDEMDYDGEEEEDENESEGEEFNDDDFEDEEDEEIETGEENTDYSTGPTSENESSEEEENEFAPQPPPQYQEVRKRAIPKEAPTENS